MLSLGRAREPGNCAERVFARLRDVPSDDVEQSYDDLIDRLAALFERAREQIAARMTETGMPFTIAVQQQVLVPNAEGTGWEGREEVVPINFLREDRSPWPSQVLAEWLVDARSVAEELGALFEDLVIVNGAFPGGSRFAGVEAGVIDRSDELDMLMRTAVLSPMDGYVKSLHSPAVGDDSLAR